MGSPLTPFACGETATRATVACPYHAWVYDLDGSLHTTPRYDAPDGFDKTQHGLVNVLVEEWHGWVFVNASGDAAPLTDYMGTFGELIAPYEPERLVVGARHDYTLAANWKLPVENYHECYHCPAIHPEFCRISPPTSGDEIEVAGMWVGGTMDLIPDAVTMSLDGSSPLKPFPGLDAKRQREVLYSGLFPNLLVSLHPDYVMTHRIEPIAPGLSQVECSWLFDPDAVASPDFDPTFASELWDITNRQDWGACESVQRGVASRGYRPGPFSREEDGVMLFTSQVARGYIDGGVKP